MIRAHVFTTVNPRMFLKQSPQMNPVYEGVSFTFGIDVPDDTDVLIVHIRASFSIPTRLPRERTVFIAGEPDVIHPYSIRFLNQFGIVSTTSDKVLDTVVRRENYCAVWFAGVDFNHYPELPAPLGYDWFSSLEVPEKKNRISVITSNKAGTRFHKKRLEFISELRRQLPDLVDFYGFGGNKVPDKKDALLPYRYHIALENGDGMFTWTEKLSDPLLCWCLPFHAGCPNISDDLPEKSFRKIDLDHPDESIAMIRRTLEEDAWEASLPAIAEARQRILTRYNLMHLFADLARQSMTMMPAVMPNAPARLVRSERSLPPESGARGNWLETTVRNAALAVDPRIELRLAKVKTGIDKVKRTWRKRK